jgi:serine/threonine protein kinase
MPKSSAQMRVGSYLNDRYKIIRELGRGGFGRAYLAEDTHRYREQCVLKEFAPDVGSDYELRKAEELFEREAGILYKLKHPQIPQFHALMKVRSEGKDSLFLIQEYIDGESYWQLMQRSHRFTEEDANQLLLEILPVLDYIHSLKLIHRDISPDNLLLRRSDRKPILIDFGCVKQAANALSRSTGGNATLIGKIGYAPHEQIHQGRAYPNSDFYSLAVTIIVLLTGKKPQDLYNSRDASWNWRNEVKISSNLGRILDKMLAHNPSDRYQSASDIIQALQQQNSSAIRSVISRINTLVLAPNRSKERNIDSELTFTEIVYKAKNIVVASSIRAWSLTKKLSIDLYQYIRNNLPEKSRNNSPEKSSRRNTKPARFNWLQKTLAIVLGVIIIPASLAFGLVSGAISQLISDISSISFPNKDTARQEKINQKLAKTKIDPSVFYQQVDRIFYTRYPKLKNVLLTDKPEHRKYREKWYQIAEDLLASKQ